MGISTEAAATRSDLGVLLQQMGLISKQRLLVEYGAVFGFLPGDKALAKHRLFPGENGMSAVAASVELTVAGLATLTVFRVDGV